MRRTCLTVLAMFLLMLTALPGCGEDASVTSGGSAELLNQHEQAFDRYLGLIDEAAQALKSASEHRDAERAVEELDAIVGRLDVLSNEVDALQPLNNDQMRLMNEKMIPAIKPVMDEMRQGMLQVVDIKPLKEALNPSMEKLAKAINSVNSPTVEQRKQPSAPQTTGPAPISPQPQPNASTRIAAEQPADPSAYIVIQNAKPADPQQLIRQLQQVLPQTQVVKQVQSPNPREIKLEVTNVKDVRALANKIPFASVESVDVPKRTITVDFDL